MFSQIALFIRKKKAQDYYVTFPLLIVNKKIVNILEWKILQMFTLDCGCAFCEILVRQEQDYILNDSPFFYFINKLMTKRQISFEI